MTILRTLLPPDFRDNSAIQQTPYETHRVALHVYVRPSVRQSPSSLSGPRESSLCEIPAIIDLREPVKIADRSDHETTLTSMYRYMMRQAVADTSRFSAIQYDRALAVEVSCGLVLDCHPMRINKARPESIAITQS
jgi:hypothetical protein